MTIWPPYNQLRNFVKFLEKDHSSFTLTTPKMHPGVYSLKCNYKNQDYQVKGFRAYDLIVQEVSPVRIAVNKNTTITVKGKNFVNTGQFYVHAYFLFSKTFLNILLHALCSKNKTKHYSRSFYLDSLLSRGENVIHEISLAMRSF